MTAKRLPGAWLGLLLALTLLAGCATEPGVFKFNAAPADGARSISWPSAESGSPARFDWVGLVTGEDNFHRPTGSTRAAFMKVIDFITGLLSGEGMIVLQRPQYVMTDDAGRIYATDTGRNTVFVFDVVAGEMKEWETASGVTRFSSPAGIAQGPGGDILVADAKLGYVARLGPNGEPRAVIGKGLFKRPTGLAYDPAGKRIYVSDTVAHDIKVFDDAGQLVKTIGHRGEGEGEFNYPTHLAFARGELYVADSMNSRIQVLSDEGEVVKSRFGARGNHVGDLVRPKGVSVDSEGNIYVIESLHDYLLVFNRRGELLLPLGGTGNGVGQFYLPAGVWVDKADRVFVADMFNGRLSVFQFLGSGSGGVK